MNPRRFVRTIQRKVINHPILSILVLLLIAYISTTSVVMIYEEVGFSRATSLALPAFLGELGIVESRSTIVEIAVMGSLIISVAFLAVLTAYITSVFVEFCARGGSIVKKVNFSDHIIICGWNFQGPRVLKELLSTEGSQHHDIVILANCEKRPTLEEQVEFIKGDPSQDEDLLRAGVKKARSVIVLSDLSKGANEADAEALMIVLAVESLNRKAHTCAQILNASNRIHLERAHADEIICLDQMGGNLVVASAINHGISQVICELLTFNSGSEFYRYDKNLSEDIVGNEFSQVVQLLAEKRIILIGFETNDREELRQSLNTDVLHNFGEDGRVVIVNPQGQYKFRQGDALFLIAEEKPASL